jgi:hypothetical protein
VVTGGKAEILSTDNEIDLKNYHILSSGGAQRLHYTYYMHREKNPNIIEN